MCAVGNSSAANLLNSRLLRNSNEGASDHEQTVAIHIRESKTKTVRSNTREVNCVLGHISRAGRRVEIVMGGTNYAAAGGVLYMRAVKFPSHRALSG
jgi:hypothetical protein